MDGSIYFHAFIILIHEMNEDLQGLSMKDISNRKEDHIDMALRSRVMSSELDPRFFYEPLFGCDPEVVDLSVQFAGYQLDYPVWISSMTGGTDRARLVNERLARLCSTYALGMGLGSCRILLERPDRLPDFQWRSILGPNRPFYANLGIAQVEDLLEHNRIDELNGMMQELGTDGLIVHINPIQEWMQPEGDSIHKSPVEILTNLLSVINYPLIVKEVGQGMGPKSLQALVRMPLRAIEFGAAGGTNFAKLEHLRSDPSVSYKSPMIRIGHSAAQMNGYLRQILIQEQDVRCANFIISGGIQNYLDGYYLIKSCPGQAIYGQASAWLTYALESYEALERYFVQQMQGLAMAYGFLTIRDDFNDD